MMAVALACSMDRTSFYSLFGLYSLAFASYIFILRDADHRSLRNILLLALAGRLLCLFIEPSLTDDYFRYIWDGMVMHGGLHPMAHTPSYLMMHPELIQTDHDLYNRLNSPDYHSVYPPLLQAFYYVSYFLFELDVKGHLLFYKSIAIVSDGAIILLLIHILKWFRRPPIIAAVYALNPMVVLEFTGNAHPDGLMIAFLLGGIYLMLRNKAIASVWLLTFSVAVKLTSGILIPFLTVLLQHKKQLLIWTATLMISIVLLLSPVLLTAGEWFNSIRLWFITFEFNASVYYIAREAVFLIKGYNDIRILGPLLGLLSLAIIFYLWIRTQQKRMQWQESLTYSLTVFYLLSTTVHPWYLGILLVSCILSRHIFPVVWSYLVFLSYSHYLNGAYAEKYVFIAAEYLFIFIWMIYEMKSKKKLCDLFTLSERMDIP